MFSYLLLGVGVYAIYHAATRDEYKKPKPVKTIIRDAMPDKFSNPPFGKSFQDFELPQTGYHGRDYFR